MLKLITSDIYDFKTGEKIAKTDKSNIVEDDKPKKITIDWKKSKIHSVSGTEIKILAVELSGLDKDYMLSLIPASEPYHGGLKVVNPELTLRFQLDELGGTFSKATANNILISKAETYIKTKLAKELENLFQKIGLEVKVEQKFPKDLDKKITEIQKTSSVMAVLKILAAKPDTSGLKAIAKKILDKFFPDLQLPELKIVDSPTHGWLGRTSVRYKEGEITTTIEIQKSIINDEKTLHRVLAHELIHCYLDTKNIEEEITYKKHRIKKDPHGDDFKKMAEKLNNVFGEDYVTETSNLGYVVEDVKEFYVIIEPYKDDKFGITKVLRPSKEQKIEISNRIENNKAHVFKTKDKTFWNATNVKKFGGFSVYENEEMQNKIANLYNSKNVDQLFKV